MSGINNICSFGQNAKVFIDENSGNNLYNDGQMISIDVRQECYGINSYNDKPFWYHPGQGFYMDWTHIDNRYQDSL